MRRNAYKNVKECVFEERIKDRKFYLNWYFIPLIKSLKFSYIKVRQRNSIELTLLLQGLTKYTWFIVRLAGISTVYMYMDLPAILEVVKWGFPQFWFSICILIEQTCTELELPLTIMLNLLSTLSTYLYIYLSIYLQGRKTPDLNINQGRRISANIVTSFFIFRISYHRLQVKY